MIKKYGFYIKDLLKIAAPIVMGNLGFIMIGVGDVIVAGRHSTDTLAAISLATAITNCIMMLGIGVLSSISSILSNYRGENKSPQKYFNSSIQFAIYLALITSALIFASIPFIDKLGFEKSLNPIIKDYFFITGFATFGGYIHCAVKEYLQAFEKVIFPNLLTIFCIFLNLGLNILFVFGYGVIPSMGAIGLAIASLITRYFMGFVLFIYCLSELKPPQKQELLPRLREKRRYYFDLLKVGLPASLAVIIEFVGFNAIAVLMGRVSGVYAAAHNILCTLTSISFMLPFGISIAMSVKIGYSNGAKDYKNLQIYSWCGISMCVVIMTISALLLGMFPEFLVSLFTTDINLINVCIPIVSALCFFQIFDGLQVALAGIFRGIKQTGIVMLSNFIAYWIISLPAGTILAFKYKLELFGFWCGIVCASVILCTIMLISMVRKFKKMTL